VLLKACAQTGLYFVSCRAIFIFMLLYTALVVIYALTSGIAGYTASSFYKQLEGTNWVSLLCPDRGGIVVWKDTEGLH
jgi:hypothetical protein